VKKLGFARGSHQGALVARGDTGTWVRPAGVFQLPSHRKPPQTTVRERCECAFRVLPV